MFGNPPFVGAKFQTAEQRAQARRVAGLSGSGGTLDYVTAWIIKAGAYATGGTRIGFVTTNSTTQGEQVGQLWPILFGRCGLEIAFAHRTFAWGSDARGMAHVHVVILGLDRRENARDEKRLFSYPDLGGDPEETRHKTLSPYLFDAGGLNDPHQTVREESRPINGFPKLIIGSKPIDGGAYIFTAEERAAFLAEEPDAAPFMRLYMGAREYIRGGERWILALHEASPTALRALPKVCERIAAVRTYREASKSKPTLKLAETPTLYHVNVLPTEPFLVVPEVSSERREYVPIGWLEPPTIPSNQGTHTAERHFMAVRAPHIRHAHGVGSMYRGATRKPIPIRDRRYLQHLSLAALGRGPVKAGAAGADGAGRAGGASGRDPGRSLRSRPDAAQPSPGAPGPRPRRGPPLPARRLRLRARAGGTSVHALRKDARPPRSRDEGKDKTSEEKTGSMKLTDLFGWISVH